MLCLLRRIFSGGITNYKPRRWGRSCGQGQGATHHSMGIGMGLETGWSSSLAHAPPHRHSRGRWGRIPPTQVYPPPAHICAHTSTQLPLGQYLPLLPTHMLVIPVHTSSTFHAAATRTRSPITSCAAASCPTRRKSCRSGLGRGGGLRMGGCEPAGFNRS